MRIILFLSVLFLSSTVFAETYYSGRGKANFGAQQTQNAEENDGQTSSVPGANSTVKTRTFSSYGSQRPWSKGVQTKGVQTRTAGTAAPEASEADESPLPAGTAQKVGSAAKKASSGQKTAPSSAAQQPASAGQAGAAPQPEAMPAEAAAAMQQMQGLQEMLKGLGGAAGGAGAGAAGAGAAAMPNIPGMPDMSALMGGAAPAGAQPGKK